MKTLLLVLVAGSSVLLGASAALAGDAAVEAPIHAMMEGFNKGDIAKVKAVHVAAPTIVDNVAPFRWSGPKAFDSWLADLGKSETAQGKSDGTVTFGAPVDELVAGDHAYVVTPCDYRFKQGGAWRQESGFTAFTLVKVAGAWKVQSWSWASPKAVAAK